MINTDMRLPCFEKNESASFVTVIKEGTFLYQGK